MSIGVLATSWSSKWKQLFEEKKNEKRKELTAKVRQQWNRSFFWDEMFKVAEKKQNEKYKLKTVQIFSIWKPYEGIEVEWKNGKMIVIIRLTAATAHFSLDSNRNNCECEIYIFMKFNRMYFLVHFPCARRFYIKPPFYSSILLFFILFFFSFISCNWYIFI